MTLNASCLISTLVEERLLNLTTRSLISSYRHTTVNPHLVIQVIMSSLHLSNECLSFPCYLRLSPLLPIPLQPLHQMLYELLFLLQTPMANPLRPPAQPLFRPRSAFRRHQPHTHIEPARIMKRKCMPKQRRAAFAAKLSAGLLGALVLFRRAEIELSVLREVDGRAVELFDRSVGNVSPGLQVMAVGDAAVVADAEAG